MRYAVVLDAGSTGSRVHSYRFKSTDKGVLTLVDDTFEQLKPGLSSFAEVLPPAQTIALSLRVQTPRGASGVGVTLWAERYDNTSDTSDEIPFRPDFSLAQPSRTLSSSANNPLSGVNVV